MAVRILLPPRKLRVICNACFSSFCGRRNRVPFRKPTMRQPVAKKVAFEATAHGASWQDPYHWMSDVRDPDFIRYIDEENSYTHAFMRETEKMRKVLYSEMVSRLPAKVTTAPERWGPWLYYQYVPEGKEYPVLYRESAVEGRGFVSSVFNACRRESRSGQVLLDWNEIAEKQGYVHVGMCRISPDHNYVAYTLDSSGHENFQLQVKDLSSNAILPQPRVDGVMSLAWAQDSRTLFYTLCDQNQRPYRVLCTKIGSCSKDGDIVFTEDDSRFCMDITSTKDGKFITLNSNSRTSSEVYVISATNPRAGLRRFCKRKDGVQFFLEHHCGTFYALTNASTSDYENNSNSGYYLALYRDKELESTNLKGSIMPGDNIFLEDMDICYGHMVLYLVKDGSPSVCSIDLSVHSEWKNGMEKKIDDLSPWYFPLPSNPCTITPASNHDFRSTKYRVVLSSPVMPDLVVNYDMSEKTVSILQQEDVRNISTDGTCLWNDFSENYACEVKEVISFDGIKIPLTILFSRKAYKAGSSPGLLHGYGAYGEALEKNWCSNRLSLLDRGWMFAFADVRGGTGSKPSWHRSGCGMNKLNSILDFISCGEYLINEGYIHRNQLAAQGISAGSLLVAAAINMRPELFHSAILKVPFLDVLNTLLDPNLPLTTLDHEEFGDPRKRAFFEYILKYSPYDNITPGVCYPSMLVSASLNDSRVGAWEAAKWVAKIRDTACSSCSPSVILRTDKGGGHFGEGGRFAECLETAYDYAFLMKVTAGSGTL